MSNIITFNPMIIKPVPELETEIIKTFKIYNLSGADEIFLGSHSSYVDDSLSEEVGISYLFNIKEHEIFNPIESYELYLEGIQASNRFIECMKIAKSENATMVKFWVVVDKSMLGY